MSPMPPLVILLLLHGGGASTWPITLPNSVSSPKPAAVPSGTWAWPVHGPVIRGFDPPTSPYGAGHRGVDIAVPVGTMVTAPESGTVTFAGAVGGELFVTIDHGGGLASTYSWLSQLGVRRGDVVARGQPIAATGLGHPGSSVPHLHLGVKLDGTYLDPLDLLMPLGVQDLIRLVPLPR